MMARFMINSNGEKLKLELFGEIYIKHKIFDGMFMKIKLLNFNVAYNKFALSKKKHVTFYNKEIRIFPKDQSIPLAQTLPKLVTS